MIIFHGTNILALGSILLLQCGNWQGKLETETLQQGSKETKKIKIYVLYVCPQLATRSLESKNFA